MLTLDQVKCPGVYIISVFSNHLGRQEERDSHTEVGFKLRQFTLRGQTLHSWASRLGTKTQMWENGCTPDTGEARVATILQGVRGSGHCRAGSLHGAQDYLLS